MKKACAPGGTQAFAGSYLLRFGSADGTYARASAALKTFIRIDDVLAVFFLDAFDGTFRSASAAADAVVGRNLVSHVQYLRFKN